MLRIDGLVCQNGLSWLDLFEDASWHTTHHSVRRDVFRHYRPGGYYCAPAYPYSIGDNRASTYPHIVFYDDTLGGDALLYEWSVRVGVNVIYRQYLHQGGSVNPVANGDAALPT
jgi:hypothetical protein